MVNSRFEYVKQFEAEEKLLNDTFICVTINMLDFDQFCIDHNLFLPYDNRIIRLNTESARHVLQDFAEIDICHGFRNEFSFIFKRTAVVFSRRRDKILTNVTSLYTSTFTYHWSKYFDFRMKYPPNFVSKITLFPRLRLVKDYLLWKQELAASQCLSLYSMNVLERSGLSKENAQAQILSADIVGMNEILFKNGINFNSLPDWHKRGKTLFKEKKIIETSDDFASQKSDFWKKHKKLLK